MLNIAYRNLAAVRAQEEHGRNDGRGPEFVVPSSRQFDPYRWLALLAWLVFFSAGAMPIVTFHYIRDVAGVLTQDALVNSPHLISLSWAAFFGFFVYFRCVEAGLEGELARGKGMQMGILALAAFMSGPLEDVYFYYLGLVEYFSWLTFSVAGFKAFLWCYLFSKVFRYYLLDGNKVFTRIPSMFPSTFAADKGRAADDGGAADADLSKF